MATDFPEGSKIRVLQQSVSSTYQMDSGKGGSQDRVCWHSHPLGTWIGVSVQIQELVQMRAPELLSEGGGNWGAHIPPLLRHCVELPLRSTNPSVFPSFIWAGRTPSGTRQKCGRRNTRHVCQSDKLIGMQVRLWRYLLCFVSCVT